MKASKENPVYTVVAEGPNKEDFELTPLLVSLEWGHQKEQMAASATITLMNTAYLQTWANKLFQVLQRIFIYANDGERHEEIFRGYIWTSSYQSSVTDRELSLKCYDTLIFLQESEDSAFFASGQKTRNIIQHFCARWGLSLDYSYESISHEKLALRGSLADIITSDVLDPVRKKTGVKCAVLGKGEGMVIRRAGDNKDYYEVVGGGNAVSTRSETTMDGAVTQVAILGKADKDERVPVDAIVKGETARYGTLQKLQDRNEETKLADAKAEARTTLKENGAPKVQYEVRCTDIPWIRKGDRVFVSAGGIYHRMLIAWSVNHRIDKNGKFLTMTLEEIE